MSEPVGGCAPAALGLQCAQQVPTHYEHACPYVHGTAIRTWLQLCVWVGRLHRGADKGQPLVPGRHVVGVRAAEDVDVAATVDLLLGQDDLQGGGWGRSV